MNTILNICEALKGFGDHIVEGDQIKGGYADLLVLLALVGVTSIFVRLIERRTNK